VSLSANEAMARLNKSAQFNSLQGDPRLLVRVGSTQGGGQPLLEAAGIEAASPSDAELGLWPLQGRHWRSWKTRVKSKSLGTPWFARSIRNWSAVKGPHNSPSEVRRM